MKANQRVNGMAGPGNGTQGVQALGENLSQLDLSEASRKEIAMPQGGGGGGGGGGADGDSSGQGGLQGQSQQSREQVHQRHHRPQPSYTQPLRDGSTSGRGGGHKRHVSGGMRGSKGGSGEWVSGSTARRPTAAEAAELLRRRCDNFSMPQYSRSNVRRGVNSHVLRAYRT